MSELTDFLLARIEEDENIARAVSLGRWYPWDDRNGELNFALRALRHPAARHIRIQKPERVLADVNAKRRIVELVAVADSPVIHAHGWMMAKSACMALAAVYDEHPDFKEEWRP